MGKKQHTIIVMSNGDIYSVNTDTSRELLDTSLTGFLKFEDLKSGQIVLVNTVNISSIIVGEYSDEQ